MTISDVNFEGKGGTISQNEKNHEKSTKIEGRRKLKEARLQQWMIMKVQAKQGLQEDIQQLRNTPILQSNTHTQNRYTREFKTENFITSSSDFAISAPLMDRSPNISGSSFGSWLRFAVGEHHATLLFQVVCNVMHCHFIQDFE